MLRLFLLDVVYIKRALMPELTPAGCMSDAI